MARTRIPRRRVNDQTIVHDILRGSTQGVIRHCSINPNETLDDAEHRANSILASAESYAKQSHVIVADNVASMMKERDKHDMQTKGKFTRKFFRQLGCCRPPFEKTMVSFKIPWGDVKPNLPESCVVLSSTQEIDEFITYSLPGFPIEDATHVVISRVWIRNYSRQLYLVQRDICTTMTSLGRIVGHGMDSSFIRTSEDQDLSQFLLLMLTTALQTYSLMNCKNIVKVPCSEEFSPEYGKGFKGNKIPDLSWARIRVDNSQEERKQYPQHETYNPNSRPLHICCGHQRTYSPPGNGFMGRGVYGTYWVEQHKRGDRKNGTVIKEYEVSVTS